MVGHGEAVYGQRGGAVTYKKIGHALSVLWSCVWHNLRSGLMPRILNQVNVLPGCLPTKMTRTLMTHLKPQKVTSLRVTPLKKLHKVTYPVSSTF